MDNEKENLIEKIKSLLRLADNQAGKPEGELAAELAHRMMRKHAIDQDQLAESEREKIVMLTAEVGRSNWLRNLLFHVANFCSCKSWIISGTRNMQIVGHETDLEIASYLFDSIREQIDFQCNIFQRGKSAANDFRMSAVDGVHAKFLMIKNQGRSEDQTGTALVLSRRNAVEDWLRNETAIRLRERQGPRRNFNSEGFNAGKNVRLSQGIGSKGSPAGIGPAAKQIKG